jgi:flagellar motility protein MotE (MotC chaperone)
VKRLFKHLRLLPAVILVGFGLLVVKGAGLARDARAEDTSSATTTLAATDATSATTDPAADDSQAESASQVDVLDSLAKRRAELDAREQDLAMRENLIAAAEKRMDGKIAQLKDLQSQIQALLGQRDDAEQKQILSLVKSYSLMKPKDAARIFNTLDDAVLMEVAPLMKPDVLGAILAQMQPDQAKSLTVKLANRLKAIKADAPVSQLAALPPPAATDLTAAPPQTTQQPDATTTAPVTPPPAPPVATPPAKAQDTKAAEIKPAIKNDVKPAAKTDAKSVVKPQVKTDAKADTVPAAKPDVKADAKADDKTTAKADTKTDAKAPGG